MKMRTANIILLLSFLAFSVQAAMADIAPDPLFEPTPTNVAVGGSVLSLAAVALGVWISKKMNKGSKKEQVATRSQTKVPR